MPDRTIDATLLDFARLQADPLALFRRPGPQPGDAEVDDPLATDLRVRWDLPVELGADLHDSLAQVPYPIAASAGDGCVPPTSSRWQRLQSLLLAAGGNQRYEATHTYNPHRSYPSARSDFAAQLFIQVDGAVWLHDADSHSLCPVDQGQPSPAPAVDGGAALNMIVVGKPDRVPVFYRELRWALTLCECGHLAENLVRIARVLGFDAALSMTFPDGALLELVGARAGDHLLPAAVIGLDGSRLTCPRRQPTPWPEASDPVLLVDRLGWEDQAQEVAPAVGALSESGERAEPPSPATAGPSWARVLFDRSSGRSISGFTAAPGALRGEALSAALDRISSRAALDWADSDGTLSARLFVTVGHVDGWRPGTYEWDVGARAATLVAPGFTLGTIQDAYLYPTEVMNVASTGAALLWVTAYDRVIGRGGARGLRRSQLELGGLTQSAGVELSAHGLFLRPCRSFALQPLRDALGLAADELPSYLCLVGRSRFCDLVTDLRPASPTGRPT